MTNDAGRQSLGTLLVDRGVITGEQLEAALKIQRAQGGKLGEILTSRGWVTPLSIAAAVAKQEAEVAAASGVAESPAARGTNWKPLGTLLLERGFVTDVQLKQALALQNDGGGFLGEILVEQGWLSAADLVHALAAQLGLDFDVKRMSGQERGAVLPLERAAAYFEVLEDVAGEVVLLKKTETFMEATDFVFDEVLWQREPGSLQIVRVDSGRREVAWSFRPGDNAAPQSDEDLAKVFGYSVGNWEDRYVYKGDGSSYAAAG